jgi:hypothetical protein
MAKNLEILQNLKEVKESLHQNPELVDLEVLKKLDNAINLVIDAKKKINESVKKSTYKHRYD